MGTVVFAIRPKKKKKLVKVIVNAIDEDTGKQIQQMFIKNIICARHYSRLESLWYKKWTKSLLCGMCILESFIVLKMCMPLRRQNASKALKICVRALWDNRAPIYI